jgi:thioredoxin 1
MADVIEITDKNFEEQVLKSTVPVLVDFWAVWCGPCRMMGPIVEQVAGDYTGKLKVGKLNVDDNPDTAARFGVRGIPTMILFANGKVKAQTVGAQPKETLKGFIDGNI